MAAIWIFIFYVALVVWVAWFPPPAWTLAAKITKDFQGNLVAGFIANLVFLVLAIQLDRRTTAKIDRIELLTEQSEAVLKKEKPKLRENREFHSLSNS